MFNIYNFCNISLGCGGTNCLPQKQSNGYAKNNFGRGGYNTGPTGCSSENCPPPPPLPSPQHQQIPPFTNVNPPPQHYVAPSLPTAECQSSTPNECNNVPQSPPQQQQTFSSGAGGTYSQRNNEGDRELLQQNKGEGFSSGNENSGYEQVKIRHFCYFHLFFKIASI